MRERIIFAPGARGSELIKNLAIHGVNCINLKIMGAGELARYTLMKSGVSIGEEFLSAKEECTVIAKAISGETYFGKTTYSDVKQIAQAVKRMRCLVAEGDEEKVIKETLDKGIFKEKNKALFKTYQNYMKILKDNNALDRVSLIRKAIAEGKALDADFEILEEYTLIPLEKELLNKISAGTYSSISVADLYNADNNNLRIENFKNCYGAPNEVETIINEIYAGKKLDNCTVALTDVGTYSQLFFDYALLYDIPVTFGCGVPIINSNPARLLVTYYHWITDGFFGRDAINAMIHSKAFNRAVWNEQFPEADEEFSWSKFYEVLGGLRLTNDEKTNGERIQGYKKAIAEEEGIVRESDEKAYKEFCQRKMCIPYLEIAAKELSISTEDFIAKYAYIRKGSGTNADKLLMKIDMSAVSAIYDELGVIRRAGIEQSTDDLIVNALKIVICGEKSEAGKLHITDISGAYGTIRENLYIAGLSASKFPGSPKEDYLLLDADIKLFGEEAKYLTSEGKIIKKREQLLSLVYLAANLGSKIYVSYAGLNVSDLKKDNASSMIFELYREEFGKNVTSKDLEAKVEKIDYFAPAISTTREIGKAYNKGTKILEPAIEFNLDLDVKVNLEKEWSPLAINTFLEDPQAFMMIYLLNIPEPEENNPFDIITPIAAGNLAHSLMERLANSDMSREDFIKISEEYFDRHVVENPPLIIENVAEAKADFMEMMENAYDSDPHREVVLKEKDIHCEHSSGVRIHGLPDRVEKLDDGTYAIVDFKSGRTVKHIKDDINTCLQVVIYAYLMEQQGLKISRGEFRYLRTGETVTCVYDDNMKQALDNILIIFKERIENFNFFGANDDVNEAEEVMGGDD